MKSKSIKWFAAISIITAVILVITLGFITADRKPDKSGTVFIRRNIYKESI